MVNTFDSRFYYRSPSDRRECGLFVSSPSLSEDSQKTQTGPAELDLNLCHDLDHVLSVFAPYIYTSIYHGYER